MTDVGCVQSLWRYPVRSMRGEELASAEVAARGVAGDRCYCVVDVAERRRDFVRTAALERAAGRRGDPRRAAARGRAAAARAHPLR